LKVNKKLKDQLEIVVEELNQIKEERKEKEARKQARANRKRLPKRDPMTAEIYKELIRAAEGPTYIKLRTRMALCILTVTGIRINELLPLKVSQLKTLFKENWIAIDRSKRGPSNHKAFLTKEGKKIIQDRQKDFQLIFLMKEPDSYIFTAEVNHSKQLDPVAITRDVNKVMREVSNQLPSKPNITSHSFRIGFITQLWKDSKDIEFVKQTIGHRKLDTTSAGNGLGKCRCCNEWSTCINRCVYRWKFCSSIFSNTKLNSETILSIKRGLFTNCYSQWWFFSIISCVPIICTGCLIRSTRGWIYVVWRC
jgi:integrase